MSRSLSLSSSLLMGLMALTAIGCGDKDPDDSNDSSSSDDTNSQTDDTGDADTDSDADSDTDADSDADSDTDTDADSDPAATFTGSLTFTHDGSEGDACVLDWGLTGEPSTKTCPDCVFQFGAVLTEFDSTVLPGLSYCDDVNSFLGDLASGGELFLARRPDGGGPDFGLHYYYYYSSVYNGFYGLLEETAAPAAQAEGTTFNFGFDYYGYAGTSTFYYFGYQP